jgi:hypothetical protein
MAVVLQPALPPDLAPCNFFLPSRKQSQQQGIASEIQDQNNNNNNDNNNIFTRKCAVALWQWLLCIYINVK